MYCNDTRSEGRIDSMRCNIRIHNTYMLDEQWDSAICNLMQPTYPYVAHIKSCVRCRNILYGNTPIFSEVSTPSTPRFGMCGGGTTALFPTGCAIVQIQHKCTRIRVDLLVVASVFSPPLGNRRSRLLSYVAAVAVHHELVRGCMSIEPLSLAAHTHTHNHTSA